MDSPWHETLRFGPSGSMEIDGVGGADDSLAFYADGSGGFTSPPDLNATLSYVAASANYELIFAAPSQQIVWFNSPADDGSGTPGLVSAVTDHNGDQTTITGDLTTGNATLVDSRGRTITRTQSSSGATWAYPDGRSWTEGARVGRSQSFTDASGGVTSYGYNAGNGKLTSIVDPAGHITAIDYNFDGKVASISQGPGGGPYTSVTQFNWGPVSAGTAVPPGSTAQSETQVTDTNGHLSRYVNKYNGQTITTMGPFAHPTSAVYNSNDLPTSQTDANGHTTSATYSATVVTDQTSMTAPPSATGQTPATTSAAYNTSSTVLDYQHLPSAATDAEGNCTARVYDAAGHLTDSYAGQTTPCDGHTAGIHLANRYQGDAGVPSCGGMAGQLCSSTSGNGQSTTYSYDSAGNQLTVTPPAPQHNTAYTYDSSSRIATVVDGSGTRSYSYDNNDRVTQIRYAGASTCTPSAGTCITYSYDANGNRTQMVDASGTSSWTYDAMNRVTKEISPTAPVNSCSSPADSGIVHVYDDLGNQISSCDSTGTTNYAYDSEGRLLATAAPITQVGLANAMLCSGCKIDYPVATRPGDQIVVGVTSAAGSSVSTPTGWTLVGAYTAGSTIETILTRIAVSGDTYVTLSSSTFSSMAVTLGVYRGLSTSTPIEAVSAAGTSGTALTVPGVTTTAAADKLLLFAGVTGAVTGDVTPGGGLVVDQGVIAHTGAMTATLSSAWLTKSGATGSVSAGYPASANLEAVLIALKPANTTQVPITYSYDNDGNRLSVNYPDGVSQNMTYNAANQLVEINAIKNSTSTLIASYSYQWRTSTADADQRETVTDNISGRTTSYTYDAFKRLTRALDTAGGTNDYRYTYDNDGNMTQQNRNGVITTATFNAADRLCWTVTGASANTCANAPAGARTYNYDTTGNLTANSAGFAASYNSRNQSSSITPAGGSAVAMTYAGEGQDSRTQAGSTGYVNADDHVLSQTTAGVATSFLTEPGASAPVRTTTSAGTFYYLYDGEQNVIGLVDSAGTRQATYTYDPYGNTTASGTAAAANPFRYAGGYQDASGLYHFGARYYDPITGRWTQLDPTSQDPGYVYAGDDPINRSDLSGTTNNANGRSCHWWGCDFRLSNSRAQQLVDLLNWGAGATALCYVLTGGTVSFICGIVSAVLWMYVGYIGFLIDHWHRGIFFRVYYWGYWYVAHQ
jgi:RHS repeat-associated protein